MSKSIVVANSLEKANEAETKLEFGDDILNILWPEIRDKNASYPIMWEIVRDFYGDFRVEPSDLESLLLETGDLIECFVGEVEVVVWLEVFRAMSRVGIEYNLAMFGIAD